MPSGADFGTRICWLRKQELSLRGSFLLIFFGAFGSVGRIDRNGLGQQLIEEGCGEETGLAIVEFDENDVSHFFCGHDARSGVGIHNEFCNDSQRFVCLIENVLESQHVIEAHRAWFKASARFSSDTVIECSDTRLGGKPLSGYTEDSAGRGAGEFMRPEGCSGVSAMQVI